uniref:Uncharacterized protein n=1 Tax=Lotharella globosa TaxID=91324 RepID=A0A6U3BD76_9EUKA|mmetsp:Transcript_28272/g.54960  ORF Transcript_28272/g.54960 Transcript_28272/m.54960 type:complete len:249 (-) Transcript_28272:66-812(-)
MSMYWKALARVIPWDLLVRVVMLAFLVATTIPGFLDGWLGIDTALDEFLRASQSIETMMIARGLDPDKYFDYIMKVKGAACKGYADTTLDELRTESLSKGDVDPRTCYALVFLVAKLVSESESPALTSSVADALDEATKLLGGQAMLSLGVAAEKVAKEETQSLDMLPHRVAARMLTEAPHYVLIQPRFKKYRTMLERIRDSEDDEPDEDEEDDDVSDLEDEEEEKDDLDNLDTTILTSSQPPLQDDL